MSLLQTSIYKYVLDLYCTEACLTGFRGARRDENMRMPDVQPMHADAEHGNQDPCQEDEEFFESRRTLACANCQGQSSNDTQRRVGGRFSPIHDRGRTEAIYTI